MRTVTTPAAQAAADQMGQELPGLLGTTSTLVGQGTVLADPKNWEGPKAQLFRSQIWPDVQAALTRLHQNLAGLSQVVADINRRTAEAGS
jgi:hypothetical protein